MKLTIPTPDIAVWASPLDNKEGVVSRVGVHLRANLARKNHHLNLTSVFEIAPSMVIADFHSSLSQAPIQVFILSGNFLADDMLWEFLENAVNNTVRTKIIIVLWSACDTNFELLNSPKVCMIPNGSQFPKYCERELDQLELKLQKAILG